ncbi:MAG TPA: hypothetical protein DCQ30_02515 [Acidimicrobiaceae bacterium]|nr:hypothetical protein [Acidimicrobiaceae bacterium]
MQIENRAAPHMMLGVLTLLSLGAIVYSLDTAPPNAQLQLRTAANNTKNAASFVLVDVESAGSTSSSSATNQERAVIVYNAPDRVEETVTAGGRSGTVLVVGNRRYERSGSGKWFDLGPPASGTTKGTSAGQIAVSEILYPLTSLAGATNVSVHSTAHVSSVYTFVPGQEALLLLRLLGTSVPPGTRSYLATIHGEFVGVEEVDLSNAGERITIALGVTQVDHAPVLHVPLPSQITTTPPT